MQTTISKPYLLSEDRIVQITDLIVNGGEINRNNLKSKIKQAEWVAYMDTDGEIICTVTLKSPSSHYISRVFFEAGVEVPPGFNKELGYAATHQLYEGQGKCQALLAHFLKHIGDYAIYALTREPAMAYILKKLQFTPIGQKNKDDFQLFTYSPNK